MNLARLKSDLAASEARVAQSERDLAEQQELVATRRRQGQPSRQSEELLELLQRTLALLVEERDRLRARLKRFS